jgi:hypothetical protein
MIEKAVQHSSRERGANEARWIDAGDTRTENFVKVSAKRVKKVGQ